MLKAFEKEKTSAYRVCHTGRFSVDRFGDDFLISMRYEAEPEALNMLQAWASDHAITIRRIYGKQLVNQPGESDKPQLLFGDASLPSVTTASENGALFEIDFTAGYSQGFFIDQRENRRKLFENRPRKLLNCFAYTCAFSVTAALQGASTLSVDLSKRSLEWGKRNFALNHIDSGNHRFIADDVFKVLPRLEKRGERFDTIILDPPTFSRSPQTGAFRVEKDFPKLIDLAVACAEKKARILLSTNCTRLLLIDLESMGRSVCTDRGLAFRFQTTPPPADVGAYAAPCTTWLHLDGAA